MRKLLCIIGATTLTAIVVAMIGISMLIWKGNGLDAESQAFVDAAVPAITMHWTKEALLDRATPELRATVTSDKITALFENFSRLRALVEYDGAKGQANMTYFTGTGGQISAAYEAKAKYENGMATIRFVLLKRDGRWRIQNFHVDGQPGVRSSQGT